MVVVVLDTTRPDRLGVYGNPRRVSPEIDRFARESVIFTHAWSTSSWTLPAHASLFTGLYPKVHGATNSPDFDADSLGENPPHLPRSAVTLAELLRENGYHTAAFAAAGWLDPQFGLLQGYEVQDAENYRAIGADEITDRAIAWLDSVPDDAPVHLFVNYFDPHDPYAPPEGFDRFPGARAPLPKATVNTDGTVRLSAHDRLALLARYDGEILFMDQQLGRLFDALRALGRFEHALIVVTSDHGELFGEHAAQGHGAWLWEEVLKVPLLVHFPDGREAGSANDTPTSLVDILPLVAQETGIPLPESVSGSWGERGRVLYATEEPSRLLKKVPALNRDLESGIRWPWKLILTSDGESQLYRLDSDPAEQIRVQDPDLETELRNELGELRSALAPLERDSTAHTMTPAARARLQALGYLE